MIVVQDRSNPLRIRPPTAMTGPDSRSVMLGLAPTPSRMIEYAWPKWLLSYESASKSVARSGHRRSRRSD